MAEAEKDRRLQALQALLRDQQADFNAACVGLDMPVLFTGPGRHPGQIAGRSPYLQPVHLDGQASLVGQIVPVKIAAVHYQFSVRDPHHPAFAQERACA